jgi:hypothetical protein
VLLKVICSLCFLYKKQDCCIEYTLLKVFTAKIKYRID